MIRPITASFCGYTVPGTWVGLERPLARGVEGGRACGKPATWSVMVGSGTGRGGIPLHLCGLHARAWARLHGGEYGLPHRIPKT